MNSAGRCYVAILVMTAALLGAVGVAEAIPPLPQTRIDAVRVEAPPGTPYIVLAGILGEIGSPSWRADGLGYYARTVQGLGEVVGREHGERGGSGHGERGKKPKKERGSYEEIDPRFADLPIFQRPLDRPFEKEGEGHGEPAGHPDDPPGRPDIPPGQALDPPGRPEGPPGRPDDPPGYTNETFEIREPSGTALLVIGMMGLFLSARMRKPH